MATIHNSGFLAVSLPFELPDLSNFQVQDPWWLLLATLPLVLLLVHFSKRRKITELYWKNEAIRDSSVVATRRWPQHSVAIFLALTMLALAYPAAQPVNSIRQEQEKALLIWVYDASESMTTMDVARDNEIISRFDASVLALADSLPTIPDDFYKLLVSFAGSNEIQVGMPTFDSDELLKQAQNIQRGERTATDFGLERAIDTCQQFFNDVADYPCEIFLLSDGDCNPRPLCQMRTEEIAAKAAESGITIHTISWGTMNSEYRPNPEDMQTLAEIGNGQHLASAQVDELASLYNDVATGVDVRTVRQALAMPYVWLARGLIFVLTLVGLFRRFE